MENADQIKSLEENLWSFWAYFGRAEGSYLCDTPNLMWFETPIAALPYNAVMRMHKGEGAEAEVDRRFEHFASVGKPFFWLLHPSASPTNLEALLRDRGFDEVDLAVGMVAKLDEIAPVGELPDGIEFREVSGNEDVVALIDFIVWRWDVPEGWTTFFESMRNIHHLGKAGSPTRAWLAWKDGEPVAKAVTHETDGEIGLHGVVTKPEARGLGLGRSICLHALHQTDDGRGKLGVLHASPMAVNLYAKMGFQEIAPFRLFSVGDSFHM